MLQLRARNGREGEEVEDLPPGKLTFFLFTFAQTAHIPLEPGPDVMSESPEKACVNCHFFAVQEKPSNSFDTLDSENRETACTGNFRWARDFIHHRCYKGVWDEEIGQHNSPSDQRRKQRYVERDREGECFFFEHREGMSLEAADELQKREADRERFWERNKWVRRGAVAAVVAVILDALLGIADFVLKFLPSGG
jgi:hypothetical protein